MDSSYKVGDKFIVELETITADYICEWGSNLPKERTLYRLKGIPMYFEESDFKKLVDLYLKPIKEN